MISLLARSKTLLAWAVESLEDKVDDPRGHYAEFESTGYKPWKPEHISDLVESGLATLHSDSDYVPSLEDLFVDTKTKDEYRDEDEEIDGSAWVIPTELGIKYAKEHDLELG
jgi:hypothetical protein